MIYLIITTSLNNNYLQLDKLIDVYSDVLKPISEPLPKIKNNRSNPNFQMHLSNLNTTSYVQTHQQCVNENVAFKAKELNNKDRVSEYTDSINNISEFIVDGIIPIIVENNGKRKTVLDNFWIDVHYTENNNKSFKHKGMNELMDIKSVIEEFNIQDDDIIIKLTGRYKILDSSFFKIVIDNAEIYDAFIKFFNVSTEQYANNDCVLGLFAIRCKYLKEFEYDPEHEIPETQFAEYVRKSNCRICELDRLGLRCKFSDTYKVLEV
jgi:hypothetical protein